LRRAAPGCSSVCSGSNGTWSGPIPSTQEPGRSPGRACRHTVSTRRRPVGGRGPRVPGVGNTSVCRTDAYPAVPTIDRLIHPSVKSPEIRMLRQWWVLASCCRRDPGHEAEHDVPGGGVGMSMHGESEVLLTPAEVVSLFRVDPKTVTGWAKAGKVSSIRTLGGHSRYRESEVRALL